MASRISPDARDVLPDLLLPVLLGDDFKHEMPGIFEGVERVELSHMHEGLLDVPPSRGLKTFAMWRPSAQRLLRLPQVLIPCRCDAVAGD